MLESGVALGVAALLVLPAALVGRAATRRPGGADLSVSDVWWISISGSIPGIDRPLHLLRPFSAPIPEDDSIPPGQTDDGTLDS